MTASIALTPELASFKIICSDSIEAVLADILYHGGKLTDPYKELATLAGCCTRTVGDRVRKLIRRGWVRKPEDWRSGQRSVLIPDREKIEAALQHVPASWMPLPQKNGKPAAPVEQEPGKSEAPPEYEGCKSEAPPESNRGKTGEYLQSVLASVFEFFTPICGKSLDRINVYKCPDCNGFHFEPPPQSREPGKSEAPTERGKSEAPTFPSNSNSKFSSSGKERTSSKGAAVEQPKTLEELFFLFQDGERRPKLRKASTPCNQMPIEWSFREEDYTAAESLVRSLADDPKWYPGTYAEIAVDKEILHGILQAGSIDHLREVYNEVRTLSYRPSDKGAQGVPSYFRSSAWERLRGYRWCDLPRTFQRLPRKPATRQEHGNSNASEMFDLNVAAAVKRF